MEAPPVKPVEFAGAAGIRKGIPSILVRTVLGSRHAVVFYSGEAQDVDC